MGNGDRRMTLVGGYAGSGKTEASKLLALKQRRPLLDKDTVTRPLLEVLMANLSGDPHDRESATYLNKIRQLEYQCLMDTVWEIVEHGQSPIVTAPFLRELTRRTWLENVAIKCELFDVKLDIIWVTSDLLTMRDRLLRRGAGRDRWKLTNWGEYENGIDLAIRPLHRHRVLDNTADTRESLIEQVSRLIREAEDGD